MNKIFRKSSPPLRTGYQRRAVYYSDSDCVEYVREDSFSVYERVDEHLTLIFDETKIQLIGFKLKGFKYIFDHVVKPALDLKGLEFLELVDVLESLFTVLGDAIVGTDRVQRSYRAAMKLAANDNVRLDGEFLKEAA